MGQRPRILVVGVGSIGERHVRCFQATGRAIVEVCEINSTLRMAVTQRYQIERSFDSLDAALQVPPEGVVIATPAQLHITQSQTALTRGCPLLIEKPLSTTLEGVGELLTIREQVQLPVGLAYVYRSHPVLTEMREALRSGTYGEPVEFIATCGQHFPFYRPAYRDIYYKDRATGGGAIQDALTHIINAAEWLVGPVDRVVADAEHQVLAGVSVEDTVHVLTRHGGVQGCFSLNQHQAPNETSLTVVCTRGTLRFEYHQNRWSSQTDPAAAWEHHAHAPLERDQLFIGQAVAFLDVLAGRRLLLCPLEEGIQTLKVNLAILQSVTERRWVEITT